MKAEEFMDALGEVNEKYIDEASRKNIISNSAAQNTEADPKQEKRTTEKDSLSYKAFSRMKLWRGIAIAACVVLVGSLVFTVVGISSRSRSDKSDSYSTNEYFSYEYETAAEAGGYLEESVEETAYYSAAATYDSATEYDAAYEESAALDMASAKRTEQDANGIPAADTQSEAEEAREYEPKIIYNVYMDMQTKQFDLAREGIESAAETYGGYIESQNIYTGSNSYRHSDYVIRIPADKLEEFLSQVGDISTVTYISRSSEDVSESYYDVTSRLETAKAKLARLQELLAEAEDMEDIITIEQAISDTEWEIDNYSGTIRYYDSRVSYSTVTLTLMEVYEVKTDEAPMTFAEKIGQSFSNGLEEFGWFLEELVIWFASSWIWLLIIAVIVVMIILLIRRHRNKKKNR